MPDFLVDHSWRFLLAISSDYVILNHVMLENPEFLKKKYDLHNEENSHGVNPVESAARHPEKQTSERVPQDPRERIQNYLDRLERLILDPEHKQQREDMKDKEGTERSRALRHLRAMVMREYVRPNKAKLAEGAAMVEERAARDMGINMEYGEDQLVERGEIAVKDLESSLDQWISYLSDLNEPYPTWFRYYVFRNVLELGEYDKDKQEFPKRTAGTNRLFPDIDRGSLAYIQNIIECAKDPTSLECFRQAQKTTGTPDDQLLTQEKAKAFSNLSFAKQYVEGMKEAGEITPEMRVETRGKWIKYSQDSDPTALWASLQNKGTAWCTKGFATAETQLKGGDFYVYYTLDKSGEPKIPRIAIRMQDGSIFEARGVADSKQNLEGNMTYIAEKKMDELPGKEKYQKISTDMKKMTTLYGKCFKEDRKTGEKTYLNPVLSKEDLVFLYEMDAKIEGFGYERDPRIDELRKVRNPSEDAPVVIGCSPDEIALKPEDINENTKAYIGKLFPGIFAKGLEHIYTSFPEGKIQRYNVEIGGKTKDQLKEELKAKKIYIDSYADSLLESKDFETYPNIEEVVLIRLTVKDIGFPNGATTDEIYKRAKELGLELCAPEVGPRLRLAYSGTDWMRIGMKQINDRDGDPNVFYLYRGGAELGLCASDAGPDGHWRDGYTWVFALRK